MDIFGTSSNRAHVPPTNRGLAAVLSSTKAPLPGKASPSSIKAPLPGKATPSTSSSSKPGGRSHKTLSSFSLEVQDEITFRWSICHQFLKLPPKAFTTAFRDNFPDMVEGHAGDTVKVDFSAMSRDAVQELGLYLKSKEDEVQAERIQMRAKRDRARADNDALMKALSDSASATKQDQLAAQPSKKQNVSAAGMGASPAPAAAINKGPGSAILSPTDKKVPSRLKEWYTRKYAGRVLSIMWQEEAGQTWFDAKVVSVTCSNQFVREKMLTPLKPRSTTAAPLAKVRCPETLYAPVFRLLHPLVKGGGGEGVKAQAKPTNETPRKLTEGFDFVLFTLQYATGEVENCRYVVDEAKLYTTAGHENINFKWAKALGTGRQRSGGKKVKSNKKILDKIHAAPGSSPATPDGLQSKIEAVTVAGPAKLPNGWVPGGNFFPASVVLKSESSAKQSHKRKRKRPTSTGERTSGDGAKKSGTAAAGTKPSSGEFSLEQKKSPKKAPKKSPNKTQAPPKTGGNVDASCMVTGAEKGALVGKDIMFFETDTTKMKGGVWISGKVIKYKKRDAHNMHQVQFTHDIKSGAPPEVKWLKLSTLNSVILCERTLFHSGKQHMDERVESFWVADQKWYPGTIFAHDRRKGHYLVYDDGEHEWIKFKQEPVRVIKKSAEET
jgi:hypothetical protein